jgi:hypothetical protein
VSDFDNYRDPATRTAMLAYVAETRGMSAAGAERELKSLNFVGLAYLYQDVVAAENKSAVALVDYDPLAIGRS